MVIALRASLHDHVLFILCTGRMNIALDNVITFTIKVLSKNICLVSESYI